MNLKTAIILPLKESFSDKDFGAVSIWVDYYLKNSKKLRKLGDIKIEYNALILKELRQSFGSIKEIYLYGLQKIFLKNFEEKISIISSSIEKRENIIQLPRYSR